MLVSFSDDRLVAGGFRDGIERFEVEGCVTKHKHFSLQNYADAVHPDTFEKLFKFSIVRDPWERAISWYFSPHRWVPQGRQPTWSPKEFVDSLHQMTQAIDMLTIGGKYQPLDALLRFETLAEDVRTLAERLKIGHLTLPHRNRSMRDLVWRKYYMTHPELVGLVADLSGTDAETFGYHPPVR
jgi:hypothetical protein